ncbi:L-serine ammonia-lyase, iron-sulfur-dependent subunit beta [Lachnobacterium bovis]|uniref:L-serine deaminase n=1 Tax=Lachnobacterium bovis TaxID=140626 RepID=A0A1H9P975_9FIRM|nr:L-serine ammonia-lyase, iron-sulfur-dependent subunit beta [Lachnobacterium bovis]SER44661.1 L-serine dehydratase [Lachnobacterium bovis]
MNIFDIIGPVMVGPSSSHTAGAVRIGLISRRLFGKEIKEAKIFFSGSFLDTGKGHGTDKALLAGLLGMKVDDENIPKSFEIAKDKGVKFSFSGIDLGDVHPNTVKLVLSGDKDVKPLEIIASSIGGGRIQVNELDGIQVNFCGDYPTLIVHNVDKPGHVTEVTSLLAHENINLATMQLYRKSRTGGNAVMVIECDSEVPEHIISYLRYMSGILRVTYLSMED